MQSKVNRIIDVNERQSLIQSQNKKKKIKKGASAKIIRVSSSKNFRKKLLSDRGGRRAFNTTKDEIFTSEKIDTMQSKNGSEMFASIS